MGVYWNWIWGMGDGEDRQVDWFAAAGGFEDVGAEGSEEKGFRWVGH